MTSRGRKKPTQICRDRTRILVRLYALFQKTREQKDSPPRSGFTWAKMNSGRARRAETNQTPRQVLGLGDLHDSNVAVHANAGEQEHAAEEVDFVDRRHHFAEADANVPALDGVEGPEGQRAQEEEVGQRQVEQVHVGHGFQAVAHGGVDPNHHEVAHGAEEEDDPEERRHSGLVGSGEKLKNGSFGPAGETEKTRLAPGR
ncbi:hypothetical protein EYF80_029272 [Liparis tanakae]|uniref:Uncharacterized protein n=1 Tax=Liparis tanakae TaxID=230148 RepID=A0A4Z2H465_9TELE|nr:hypothetical protein EYF80_029272 [Liparis tanakae]